MATWSNVRNYLEDNFNNVEEDDGLFTITFSFDDGRSQMVFISKAEDPKGDDWIFISSPIGELPLSCLNDALDYLSNHVCGGMSKVGDYHCVRQTFPLEGISGDQLLEGINMVAVVADLMEEKYIGEDAF